MNESRIGLTERLRTEGRWAEASQFKDQVLRGLRGEGMKKAEAGEAAWEAMAEQFPPLALAEAAAVSVRVQRLGDIPESWGELPSNTSLQAELSWCQANRLRVVEERPSGATRVHLDRARSPAPSWAALGWLETSIRSYAKYVDVVAKSLKDKQEMVRRERMQIDEMRDILKEMHSQWAEELVANTPETIRVKVRSLLEDWAGRSGLTIPDKAKYDLGGHIGELVDDCLKILAPSAGGG
jgi:hypothetical protein